MHHKFEIPVQIVEDEETHSSSFYNDAKLGLKLGGGVGCLVERETGYRAGNWAHIIIFGFIPCFFYKNYINCFGPQNS